MPSLSPPNDLDDRTPFDRLYRGVLRALYEGRMIPGQRLIEPDLMQEFAIGRSTVREVLLRLASDGIITLVRHRGAMIRRLTRAEVRHLLDLVEALLCLAARRAATEPGDNSLADALDAVRMALAADDLPAFAAARERFYRAIVERSGNRELARIFPGVLVRIMRLQLAPFGRGAEGMEIEDYAALAGALASGDADAAEAAARQHVRGVHDAVGSFPDRAFATAVGGRLT